MEAGALLCPSDLRSSSEEQNTHRKAQAVLHTPLQEGARALGGHSSWFKHLTDILSCALYGSQEVTDWKGGTLERLIGNSFVEDIWKPPQCFL